MSFVVKPALNAFDELAALRECDLNFAVSTPAFISIVITHLVIVGLETGLWGGAKLSQNDSLSSFAKLSLHGLVVLRYESIPNTGQRALS